MRASSFTFATILVGALAVAPTLVAPSVARADETAPVARASAIDPSMAALMSYAAAVEAGAVAPPADAARCERDPATYRLKEIPSDAVDRAMPIAGPQTGLPASLQGLFWMDGNPLPDEIVSFGASTYDAANHRTSIKVYDQDIWSWHADLAGRALYDFVRRVQLVYELQLDDAEQLAVITPVMCLAGHTVRVPQSLVLFTARLAGDGVWIRDSYLFGQHINTYVFRRVVRADGTREPSYDDYVKQAPKSSVLAQRIE